MGHLDLPASLFLSSWGVIHVYGWALLRDGRPVHSVEAFYNGARLGLCHYGVERPDVFGVYPERADAKTSGFEGFFSIPRNFFGWLEIIVRGVDGDRCRMSALYLVFSGKPASVKGKRKSSKFFGVNVTGCFSAESGLGEAARGCVGSMRQLKIPLSLIDFGVGTHNRKEDRTLDPSLFQKKNPHSVNLLCMNPTQVMQFVNQAGIGYFKKKYNIGMWWWELPEFPQEWRSVFSCFDEIWTGSRFSAQALQSNSPVPVYEVPPVVQVRLSRPYIKKDFGIHEGNFVFLFIFDFLSFFERKNPLAIVEAFRKAFRAGEPAQLVIKSINGPCDPKNLARLKEAEGPQMRVIDEYFSRDETNGLISVSDAYVSLHRSEGFGFTLAEAMFLGKPVIATAWSGNRDYMTMDNGYLVPYKLRPIERDYGPYRKGNVWADPELTEAARLMRMVYENPALAYEKARRGSATIKNLYSKEAVAGKIKERLAPVSGGYFGE